MFLPERAFPFGFGQGKQISASASSSVERKTGTHLAHAAGISTGHQETKWKFAPANCSIHMDSGYQQLDEAIIKQ